MVSRCEMNALLGEVEMAKKREELVFGAAWGKKKVGY